MFNLTNKQLKYLAYSFMGIILVILLSNIFLTKINNNYNNSTFESFGNMREGMDNKKNQSNLDKIKKQLDTSLDITSIKKIMCSSSIKEIKEFSEAFKEDLPKLQGYNIFRLMTYYSSYVDLSDTNKERESLKTELNNIKFNIDILNTINDNMHYLDNECSSGISNYTDRLDSSLGKFKDKKNADSKSDSKSKSWF